MNGLILALAMTAGQALPAPRPGWSLREAPRGAEAAVGRLEVPMPGRPPAKGSATVIGPRREDGRWHVLTAAHVLSPAPRMPVPRGTVGWLTLKDGRTVSLSVVDADPALDVALMVTRLPWKSLPHAPLAKEAPKEGDRVWHCGYSPYAQGRVRDLVVAKGLFVNATPFHGEVGHGDSGGGVFNERGELVGVMTNGDPGPGFRPDMPPGIKAPPYRRGLFKGRGVFGRLFGRLFGRRGREPRPSPLPAPRYNPWSLNRGGRP